MSPLRSRPATSFSKSARTGISGWRPARAKADLLKVAQSSRANPQGAPPRELPLIRVAGLGSASRSLPYERSKRLMQEIGAVIRAASLGGDSAGRLGEEEFGLIRGGAQGI